ncbi:hypothetical protein, partial [Escherichia coli]|uniref:hypothetical protein n=1 Tax=Escherichia coli TaxID=562 RepID=UPI0019D67CD2
EIRRLNGEQDCFEHLKVYQFDRLRPIFSSGTSIGDSIILDLFSEGSGNSLMNRDDKLKQVAAEFGFDPDETI